MRGSGGCRILRDVDPQRIQPVNWQAAAAPAAAPPPVERRNPASEDLRARVSELERTAKQVARESYEAGMRQGEAAARERAAAELHAALEGIAKSAAEVAAYRTGLLRRAEADVLRLSIEIARRILHRELTVDPAALSSLVRVALEKIRDAEVSRIRVHPEHAEVVRACLESSGAPPGVEVVADRSLPRGGTVFEMSRGNLDASLETQLCEIERGLIDRLEARP